METTLSKFLVFEESVTLVSTSFLGTYFMQYNLTCYCLFCNVFISRLLPIVYKVIRTILNLYSISSPFISTLFYSYRHHQILDS